MSLLPPDATGWTSKLSAQASSDVTGVLEQIAGFTLDQINHRGGFAPFGVSLNHSDEFQFSMSAPNESADEFNGAEAAETIKLGLRLERESLRCAAVAVDATVQKADGVAQDALIVDIEHAEGASIRVVTTYGHLANSTTLGFLEAQSINHLAFVWAN